MTIKLNDTIDRVRDQDAAAWYLVGILGLAASARFGPFTVV